MLKIIQNSNILENQNSYTKCAEIHYLASNFNIVCVICREFYQEFQLFLKHFQDMHIMFMKNLQNLYDNSDPILKEKQIDKRFTQKCVKQELPEVADQVQHQEGIVKSSSMVGKISKVYKEDITYGELCCKVEDCQERVIREPESTANQINITDIENVTNYGSEEKSIEIDWSSTLSPAHIKLNENRPYKQRNQPHNCSYCGKTFRRRYQLDTHLNIHTGLKPHQCDVCGRQFRAITTLQRHLNTHGKRQTYTCQYCSKEFTHRAALVSHETRHTQERCVPCEDCSKMFYTQNQLDTHKRKLHNKTDDFSLPYACDICPKRYRSASMLSTHKFKKHYKMAKFGCGQCDKKFVDQIQLNLHMSKIHFKNC